MRGFQKGITLDGLSLIHISEPTRQEATSYAVFCLKKNCKIFASECGSKSGIMRGFQKGITLGGRTSGSFHVKGLRKRVAKKFANFLASSVNPSQGS